MYKTFIFIKTKKKVVYKEIVPEYQARRGINVLMVRVLFSCNSSIESITNLISSLLNSTSSLFSCFKPSKSLKKRWYESQPFSSTYSFPCFSDNSAWFIVAKILTHAVTFRGDGFNSVSSRCSTSSNR